MKQRVCLALVLGALQAPVSRADSLASYRKADALLQRAIGAHGGAAGLERARTFSIRAKVINHSIHQSPRPEPPFETWSDDAWYANDPAGQRFVVETDRTFRGFRNHYRTISIREQGQYIDYLARTVVPEGNLDGLRSLLVRLLPQGLLREASSRRSTLRSVEKSDDGLDGISYVRPSGEVLTLYLDGRTHRLSRTETLRGDTIDGDVAVVTRYRDYQAKDGLMIPFALEVRRGRWLASETKFRSVEIGKPLDDQALFVPPFRAIATNDPAMELVTVGANVHVVRHVPDGYNVLCVEFRDHLIVVETPEGNVPSGISRGVIALIKQKFPTKPIRYAVPTHHHSDHAGGVLAYAAANEDIGHTTGLGDTQALIDAVERLGLEVKTVHGGHGREVSYAWLKQFTARRAADGKPMWACTAEELLD